MTYPTLTKILVQIMVSEGLSFNIDSVAQSLDRALTDGQFRYIFDDIGRELGFYSWEVNGHTIGITNLVIYKGNEHKYNLHKIITYLRARYDVHNFIWKKRKTGALKVFKQRNQNAYI